MKKKRRSLEAGINPHPRDSGERSRSQLSPLGISEAEVKGSETVQVEVKKTFSIGSHEVEEVVKEGEEVSYLRCIKCGVEVQLLEADKLISIECGTVEEDEEKVEAEKTEKTEEAGACEYCGGRAIGRYYVSGASPTEMMQVPVCEQCLRRIEEFFMKNRPTIVYGKKIVRLKYPADEDVKVAWVNEISTFFTGRNGSWPCPKCGKMFNRLAETVKHFIESHPELTSTKDRIYTKVGEAFKTWQGLFCRVCGLMLPDEDALVEHHRIHHEVK